MCGLVGLIGDIDPGTAEIRVRQASQALQHRGPDGDGLFVQGRGTGCATLTMAGRVPVHLASSFQSGEGSATVVLGHRRLAILDPTPRAAQPMVSSDGRYALVLNGEVYNYLELREALERDGASFVTASDTEVLLAAFARWGTGVFDRLVGMFAFAVLDRLEQAVWLARDSFGMKPLYWARSEIGFGFASEPGILLSLLDVPAVADVRVLADYLLLGVTDHRPDTMFSRIQSLPRASWMRIDLRTVQNPTPTRYWRLPVDAIDDRPADRIATELRDRFLDSVRLHLRSDVRVGTLLSGGVDSSAIVMSMREVGGSQLDIRTFSFIPDEGAVSEERWIDAVNAEAGAIPHKVRISREEWEHESSALAGYQGEPFGTLAVYAQSRLYAAAADQGVKVLLDGQGADEMFAGYNQYRGARVAAHAWRQQLTTAVRVLNALRHEGAVGDAVTAFADAMRILLPPAVMRWARRRRSTAEQLIDPWLTEQGIQVGRDWRPLGRRLLQERLRDAVEVSSLPGLLRYADRSSMMHGVESRLPFVTRELATFAMALPDHLLMSDTGVGKAIFRRAMRGIVPDAVLDRREKIGFAVPLRSWLLGSAYVNARLRSAANLPCIDAGPGERLLARLNSDRPIRHSEMFMAWRLLGLAEWCEHYRVAIP